jgi:hypothetical protein
MWSVKSEVAYNCGMETVKRFEARAGGCLIDIEVSRDETRMLFIATLDGSTRHLPEQVDSESPHSQINYLQDISVELNAVSEEELLERCRKLIEERCGAPVDIEPR